MGPAPVKSQQLVDTARLLVAGDNGLLAMDESIPTCNKRFASLGILALTSKGQVLNDQRAGTVEASVRKTLQRISGAKVAVVREVLNALARDLGVDTDVAKRSDSA